MTGCALSLGFPTRPDQIRGRRVSGEMERGVGKGREGSTERERGGGVGKGRVGSRERGEWGEGSKEEGSGAEGEMGEESVSQPPPP